MTPDESRQPLSAGTETRAAFEAGASHSPHELEVETEQGTGNIWLSTIPWGAEQAVFNPEPFEATPRRRRGRFVVQDVDSLVAYTQRHSDAMLTTTWVDMDGQRITSVLNDHGVVEAEAAPQWGDHTATLDLTVTPEWVHWASKNGQLLGQTTFAEHIEDGVREIITPDAATMLEIAQTFHAHTDAQFRQATRLQTGQVNFRYDEETTAKAGAAGDLEVPQAFVLGIAPFLGEPAYEVTARLRYRVTGGNLMIGYKLDRPDDVLRDAMLAIAERLRSDLETPVLTGKPADRQGRD